MISLPDRLPLICHRRSYTTTFKRDWVRNSLQAAARRSGYGNWWLGSHVEEAVFTYLDSQYPATVVSTESILKAMRAILQSIGYADIAEHLSPPPPPVDVHLTDLADRASTGYELAFFDLLDREISHLLGREVMNIRFCGLRYSVKQLRSAKRWHLRCSELQHEIVDFVTTRIHGALPAGNVAFTLA